MTVHSFATLLEHLASQCKNYCYPGQLVASEARIEITTDPTPLQARAFELLECTQ
ncbi:hypothetical protein ACFL34_00910 [Candidatus Sumerlaeota bacterium]